jgi:hypothetical protein
LAETRIDSAVARLESIAASQGTACSPALMQSLRRATFEAAAV